MSKSSPDTVPVIDPVPSPLQRRRALDDQRSYELGKARSMEVARDHQIRSTFLVPDDYLGHPTMEQLHALHLYLTEKLHRELEAGVTVHRRLSRLLRALPALIAILDGLILYSFCADIFNALLVDLSRGNLAALALAVLGSGVSFAWLCMAGDRLRDHRDELGEICWRQLGRSSAFLLAGSSIIAVVLAVLMYERVREQITLGAGLYVAASQAGVLALVFAVLSAMANLAVVAVHALDGSVLTALIHRTGRALSQSQSKRAQARHTAWNKALRAHLTQDPLDENSV